MMTGQHHAREIVTNQMVLFALLKMIHGGIVHNEPKFMKLLEQNKYYAVPTVNVDGFAEIEKAYVKDGSFLMKRKNMNTEDATNDKCQLENSGVDLNRNYGYSFAQGDNSVDVCSETYRGPHAFSEPETRAMRDFITEHRDEIKFVMNFHAFGNLLVIPFNGNLPNDLMKARPELHQIFSEIVNDSQFPDGEQIGPSTETMGIQAGGDAGDWITYNLSIPAGEAELGQQSDYNSYFVPKSVAHSRKIIDQNWLWLEQVFEKAGNQISIQPIGYVKSAVE